MVPAQKLHLLRDAHGATPVGVRVTTAPPSIHMAQEPHLDQHRESSSKQPPPPPQEGQADRESRRHGKADEQPALLLPPTTAGGFVVSQEDAAAGTSGSSSGNGGGGDWLRLGLSPASSSPGAAPGSHPHQLDLFADRAARPLAQRPPPLRGMDVASFLRPAVPGIPQEYIALPAPSAGPPWLPPWSPAAAAAQPPPPPTLQFAHRTSFYAPGPGASGGMDTIRVLLPPASLATGAGVWFVLQAAPHQGREPFLPQIPRSYLRIKDVRVTVRLLIKYLVHKLGLEDESEVEITCRGRPVLPFLTLQHVRDSMWCQGDDAVPPSVAPDMPAAANHHLMVLQYGRRP